MRGSNFDHVVNASGEVQICCPSCGDMKYHLYLNYFKRVGHCFRCGIGGSFKKLKDVYEVDIPDERGIEMPLRQPVLDEKPALIELPEGHALLLDSWFKEEGKPFRVYLEGRGVNLGDVQHYRLGYCPYGEWMWRVIIPYYEYGRVLYYQGRSIIDSPSMKKYKNPTELAIGVGKSNVLFNADACNESEVIVVCEGAFSAMAVGHSAVGISGNTVSEFQLSKVANSKAKDILVMLDGNAWDFAVRLANSLYGASYGKTVWLASLMYEEDPASVSKDRLNTIIDGVIEFNPSKMAELLML